METVTIGQLEWAHQRLVWRSMSIFLSLQRIYHLFTFNPVCLTAIHILGILASVYRISRRWKTRQSGLDDHTATLALILDLIFFPTLWLRNGDSSQEVPSGGLSTTVAGGGLLGDNLPADIETRIAQVVIGWLVQIVYPLLTW